MEFLAHRCGVPDRDGGFDDHRRIRIALRDQPDNLLHRRRLEALGLKVPVQRNWSYENLSVSPCRYSGSAYAGNLAIIAHTYHFGKLSSLALDATVTFTDMENNVFRYVVREKNTISPNDANEIAHSGYDLTLVTCTLSGTKRVAVYCERVK